MMTFAFGIHRFVLSFLVVCLLTPSLWSAPPDDGPSTMNVMTWNIRYDNRGDGENAWTHRKDWVADIIRREQVDIVGLQEVLKHQLDDLTQRLPELAAYGVGRDDGNTKGEYSPILYRKDRFEVLDKSTFWLSKTPDQAGSRDWDSAITRIASWLKLKDRRTGQVFYAINTHFDHMGNEARANSAALLVKMLREKFKDHPVVLTGDFNTKPESVPYKTLTDRDPPNVPSFYDALAISEAKPQGPDSTWNGFDSIVPGQRIDFLFVTGSFYVRKHRTLDDQKDGRFPSDHLPVTALIEFVLP
ncbi:MAG TPA: endonuclease/exonuclease/phosphatase family protein [Planctomycetaceae bacterium]|nr:endonuclease/exonuclease/phosphatase family protein [Planctomycetaceae bacterium]